MSAKQSDEEVIIECQKCGREIGKIQKVFSNDWLVVNGIAITVMRGVCVDCGQEFHWSISEKKLAQLFNKEG